METRVGIALGANLGDKLAQLQQARDLLVQLSSNESTTSSEPTCHLQAPIYHSAPLDCPDGSPDFYNTVIEISYSGSPQQLLEQTQHIENILGRESLHGHNTPRLIDLDILYFGNQTLSSPRLIIPHPELTSRSFVLQPLADIKPELTLPSDICTIAEHTQRLDSSSAPLRVAHRDW